MHNSITFLLQSKGLIYIITKIHEQPKFTKYIYVNITCEMNFIISDFIKYNANHVLKKKSKKSKTITHLGYDEQTSKRASKIVEIYIIKPIQTHMLTLVEI